MVKVNFEVFANSGARLNTPYITTDRHGRFRMSSGLVTKLSLDNRSAQYYIGYDAGNHRIMLGPVDVVKPTNANPITFDKMKHYASSRSFFQAYRIPFEATRYIYDGDWNGWLTFKCANFDADDKKAAE
jgi:hypothetical protein